MGESAGLPLMAVGSLGGKDPIAAQSLHWELLDYKTLAELPDLCLMTDQVMKDVRPVCLDVFLKHFELESDVQLKVQVIGPWTLSLYSELDFKESRERVMAFIQKHFVPYFKKEDLVIFLDEPALYSSEYSYEEICVEESFPSHWRWGVHNCGAAPPEGFWGNHSPEFYSCDQSLDLGSHFPGKLVGQKIGQKKGDLFALAPACGLASYSLQEARKILLSFLGS